MKAKRIGLACGAASGSGMLFFLSSPPTTAQRQGAAGGGRVAADALLEFRPVLSESSAGSTRIRTEPAGRIYVLNKKDSTVAVYERDLTFVRRIGSFGQGPEDLRSPSDFAVNRAGELIVADTLNNRVQVFSPRGESVGSFSVERPLSVDVLSSGEILVVGDDK